MAETGAAADIETNPVTPGLTPFQRGKTIIGGSLGNLVEWYDWFAYTSFSIYFASSFFPEGDDTAQWLKAALVNIVSFGARPVGAWAMGQFADRHGRKTALIVAVLMMCVGALIIAVAPTYAKVGGLAPWILAAARLLQGLSVGGQYGASATYMSEMGTKHRRGFWSSFQYMTLIAGQVLAVLVLMTLQKFMPEADLKAWGWRIAFYIGAGLAVVVFLIQYNLQETDSFKNSKAAGHKSQSTFALFAKYPKEALAIIGLTAGGTLGFYAYTTYMLKFLQNTAHFSKTDATFINLWVLVIFMMAQPLWGYFSDLVGRKLMLISAFGLGMLVAVPIFSTIATTTSVVMAILLCSIPLLINSGYSSISAVVKSEMFPAHVRALGVALPYALANAVFGGTAEPLALGWKTAHHESYFYWYVAGVLAVGFVVSLLLRDTRKHSLILEG